MRGDWTVRWVRRSTLLPLLALLALTLPALAILPTSASPAAADKPALATPTSDSMVANNIVGLNLARHHAPAYIKAAADVVNANGGDWGYVTVLLTYDERDVPRAADLLQVLLDRCYEAHVQPVVRLGTRFDVATGIWERPAPDDPEKWRAYLERGRWPARTVWVIPANEPNLGREWGGSVDVGGYTRHLERTLDVFADSDRFKVVNAPLSLANGSDLPRMQDAFEFTTAMARLSPGLFGRLPALASHSYRVETQGDDLRYTERAYEAELAAIGRDMPVLIVESGLAPGASDADSAAFFARAFGEWQADPRIVFATPLFWDPDANTAWMFRLDDLGRLATTSETYQRLRELPRTGGSPEVAPILANRPLRDETAANMRRAFPRGVDDRPDLPGEEASSLQVPLFMPRRATTDGSAPNSLPDSPSATSIP
ncbi:MAG: hypothetical protein IT305_05880 [Chloroflexi bacterium]|nr:hypothetical protein [Chloroflexota bacterium]